MTYDYICEACGHSWEAQQSISDDPLKDCPKCGAARAKRQISLGGGFILKGGGWYSDLYSSPGANAAKSEASSESSKDSKSEKTSAETSTAKDSGSAKKDSAAPATSSATATSSPATPAKAK